MESEETIVSFKKEEAGENIFDRTARIIFYALGFLLPLWILPIAASPLEFNKAYLVYFLVIFTFFFWLAGRVKAGFVSLPGNFFLVLLALLALIWGMAAIFSQSPHFSLSEWVMKPALSRRFWRGPPPLFWP